MNAIYTFIAQPNHPSKLLEASVWQLFVWDHQAIGSNPVGEKTLFKPKINGASVQIQSKTSPYCRDAIIVLTQLKSVEKDVQVIQPYRI